MAAQSDPVDCGEHVEHFHESQEYSDRIEGRQAEHSSPSPQGRDLTELVQEIRPFGMPHNAGGLPRHKSEHAAKPDLLPLLQARADGFNANTLASGTHRQPLALHPGQAIGYPVEQPLHHANGLASIAFPHDDQEGAAAGCNTYLDSTGGSRSKEFQGFPTTQPLDSSGEGAQKGSQGHHHRSTQQNAPRAKRRVRKLRKKRPTAPITGQAGFSKHEATMQHDPPVARDGSHSYPQPEPDGADCSRSNQHQEQHCDIRPSPPHPQLQNEMKAVAVCESSCSQGDPDVVADVRENERFEQYDPQTLPMMHHQYFQPQQDQYGVPSMGLEPIEDMQPVQCPSSDIVGEAAHEFEHKVYRKQQAKSAKHHSERSEWQKVLQQEVQAKRMLQDRFDVLQQEKKDLASAIEKQETKIASFEVMANKLKTFIGGLTNDMGTLKRDASSYRENCRDIREEATKHKVVLNDLLSQLSGNAEKSSKLQNEAIKACHQANSELSTATVRAAHLEVQLKENVLLLAEEKSLREQLQSQLGSAVKESRDATLRLLKSSEQSVLDKLSEIAISLTDAENGEAITEHIGKTLTAVQGLNSQQAATVNDVALLKGIIEQLSESLTKSPYDTQQTADPGSSLQSYIEEALKCLKSDLCQQEKLAAQDATNRETIASLQARFDHVTARMAECNSTLSTTQANESQLREQKSTLQAKVDILQSQTVTVETVSSQLSQLRAELNLKVTDLQNTKAELDKKIGELSKLSITNGELRAKVTGLELLLDAAPSAESVQAALNNLKEKHREELESARQAASELFHITHDEDMAEAANALKKMTSDHDKKSAKVATTEQELASSKQRLDDLQREHALNISSMQGRIESAATTAADRGKEVDALRSKLDSAERATDEAASLSSQLAIEQKALQKAVQEKDVFVEQMGLLRRERKKGEEQLEKALNQCRIDSKGMEQHLKGEVSAAKERSTRANQQMQVSTEEAIRAAKEKQGQQLQALQKSLQESQTSLQSRVTSDEEFREDLQRSWQSEEKKYQAVVTALNGKFLEAVTQRDEAIADNAGLRKSLAETQRSTTWTSTDATSSKASVQPADTAAFNDPRLQNRRSQPEKTISLGGPTVFPQESRTKRGLDQVAQQNIQSVVFRGTNLFDGHPAHTHEPSAEESQLESQPGPSLVSDHPHVQSGLSAAGNIPSSHTFCGSANDSSQRYFSAHSQLSHQDYLPEDTRTSKQACGSVVEESHTQAYSASGRLQKGMSQQVTIPEHSQQGPPSASTINIFASHMVHVESTERACESNSVERHGAAPRRSVVEATQQTAFASPQHGLHLGEEHPSHQQCSYTIQGDDNDQSCVEVQTETQFVPETQYETGMQAEEPLFAKFNAATAMRKANKHELLSDPFENTSTRTGSQSLRDAPARCRKPMPPSNTATKRVRPGSSSSSLSSIPEDEPIRSSSAAAPKMVSMTGARYKTPEPRSQGGKPRPTQSTPSVSSPGFVEQMAKGRSQNTYHAGGFGNNAGNRHHSNHKEPRAVAPKRKAQSQIIGGYEQERKKKQFDRSSQGDGNSLSELVASQNKGLQAPGSSQTTPRTATQPSRMQTFAGASATGTRQLRKTTRKTSKNDEIKARFERELHTGR